jgi:DNA-directed RNA polymerase specialized sigma24 family protein
MPSEKWPPSGGRLAARGLEKQFFSLSKRWIITKLVTSVFMLVSKKCRLRIMSKKSNPGSVSHWLANPSSTLCDEGPDLLWKRFGMRLVRLARKQLKFIQDRTYDAEDLAQSAFGELHRGIDAGNFSALANRKQLWKLLVTISLNKSRNVRRDNLRHKRRHSKLTSAAAHLHLGRILDDPKRSPEWVAMVADQCEFLLTLLDQSDPSGKLRRIALMRLDGVSKTQIAIAIGCTRRTVLARIDWIQSIWLEQSIEEEV